MRKLGLRSCHVRFMADFRQARRAWGFADSLATLARITAVSGILLATAARAEDTLTLGRGDTPALGERRNAAEGTAAPTRLTREDLGSVLPLFLKSSESRQLAADLVSLLRQGDHATARKLLENFIDASIFASLATDWLDDPTLLSTLDAQGIKSTGSRPKAGDPATAAQVSDLQKALEQERERGQALAREKAAASEKLASLQAGQQREGTAATQAKRRALNMDLRAAPLVPENRAGPSRANRQNAPETSQSPAEPSALGRKPPLQGHPPPPARAVATTNAQQIAPSDTRTGGTAGGTSTKPVAERSPERDLALPSALLPSWSP